MVRHDIKKPKAEPAEQSPEPEPYRPMGVQGPSDKERIEALELQMQIFREKFNKLYREHHMVDAL